MAATYSGLSKQEVMQRIDDGKVNRSSGSISKTKKQIFRTHLLTYFNFLNLFLGALVLTTGQFKNMLFLGTIIANSVIGIIQELRVKSLVDKLSVITASKAKVIRGGQEQKIGLEEIVLDDIMMIESGDQIGADCTLLDGQGVEVNESMITGESVAVKKGEGDELLSGSFVTAGSGVARVIHVGDENYATILASKARNKKRASSEMQIAINRIIKAVGVIIIPVGILLYMSQKSVEAATWSDAIVNTVAGVTGMIPEGLVLLTSVSFIVGVGKLAMKKALVQEMEAIESLARVNVLCLDKTGTITTGELEVQELVTLGDMSEGDLRFALGEIVGAFNDENPTQKALKDFFPSSGQWKSKDLIPFSSARKLRAVSFEEQGAFVMGAPEFILGSNKTLIEKCNEYAMQGLRVLLIAKSDHISSAEEDIGNPRALGLIVISDCVREDAPDTFKYFRSQGVDIKVISGDNPATVSQIAQKAGLDKADRFVDAQTLPEDDREFRRAVLRNTVFGRVTPEQKQRLVGAFKAEGKVVGMVGDGVNDVLALKDADCGIAMAAGSDAARQVAHIVLLDSDFSHLKEIVREGRTIISNIERVSALYLTKTIYSILLCIIFIILSKPYPFVPMHLTLVSTVAIGIPSFFLALEPNDSVKSGGFMRHVLRTALPGALTMVICIMIVHVTMGWLGLGGSMLSTYNLLVLGMVSMMVLIMVSSPMNKIRKILCYIMSAIFIVCIFVWPQFFGIERLFNWRLVFLVPLVLICYVCMKYLKMLARAIFRNTEGQPPTRKERKPGKSLKKAFARKE